MARSGRQPHFASSRNGAFRLQAYSGFFLSSGRSFPGGVSRGFVSGAVRWSCLCGAGAGAGLASGRSSGLGADFGGGVTGFGGGGSGAFSTAGFGGCSGGCARRSGAGVAAGGGADLSVGRLGALGPFIGSLGGPVAGLDGGPPGCVRRPAGPGGGADGTPPGLPAGPAGIPWFLGGWFELPGVGRLGPSGGWFRRSDAGAGCSGCIAFLESGAAFGGAVAEPRGGSVRFGCEVGCVARFEAAGRAGMTGAIGLPSGMGCAAAITAGRPWFADANC